MVLSTIKLPSQTFIGWGSMERLDEGLQSMKSNKILLITDQILLDIGLLTPYMTPLQSKYRVEIYTDVEPEPTLACAQRLVDFARIEDFDCIVGIGGGSVLDLAKLAAVISDNEGDVADYLNLTGTKPILRKGKQKILIPTTSGTGSEVTDIAVLSLDGTKDVITHKYLLSDLAIVDPQLTVSVPRRITAATGVDALTHAIESYLSVQANDVTDGIAIQAIKLIGGAIRRAVQNGETPEARSAMSHGSYLAGLAFHNAGVAGVHALAYPLGSQYKLPHGESNAVLLPYVMDYIKEHCQDKMSHLVTMLGDEKQTPFEVFHQLIEDVGLPVTLKEYGVKEASLVGLSDDANKQTRLLARSPLPLNKDDILNIYQHAYKGVPLSREAGGRYV
ncbi:MULTISPECIES: iron-containing alcohol dehydrogenase [unclassified Bacillus (in: firmicutes)]|uniref:iron-containing alcohol dehydrogenase n=1 Tax=unclassified Bacillus (in: firmicutes) TaxID=185979 RepID=UPI00080AC9EC|nr:MULTISPECIES: iron-containing alcohol dehydrogenase [unclassified Bacillus (in: firmicutes)]OCA84775.1 alcohol dehydrogenase [Bacillus sp. FJAT-27986]